MFMNRLKALIASLFITLLVACAMFAIGINALGNRNAVPLNNAPIAQAVAASSATGANDAQVKQLQDLVAQYQAREQQYQQQLDQANQQLQNYQAILNALQQRGIIRVTTDGRVLIRGFSGGDGD
jgi:uncharacterized protein YlxW (UPF0749 family)